MNCIRLMTVDQIVLKLIVDPRQPSLDEHV